MNPQKVLVSFQAALYGSSLGSTSTLMLLNSY